MSYITLVVALSAGLGPAHTLVTGTEICSDADGVTLYPDTQSAEMIRQYGPLPRPIRVSRQHIIGTTLPNPRSPLAKSIVRTTPDGFARSLVRAGVAMLSMTYPDWKVDREFTPEEIVGMIGGFADETGTTLPDAYTDVANWFKTVHWYPAAQGMIAEGDRATGVVLRSDGRGVKIQWPGDNVVQDYTWPQVSEHGFTFRLRRIGDAAIVG